MKKQELFNNVTEGFPYQRQPRQIGLYDAAYEHDACGVGMLVNIHGEKSHDIVESALKVLENMRHRGAEGRITRPVTVQVSCFKFRMSLFYYKAFPSPKKDGTAQDYFFTETKKIRQLFLVLLLKKLKRRDLH